MDYRFLNAKIAQILNDSPLTKDSVIQDVIDFTRAGEQALAFDTICSWLYEDELSISREFYDRLVSLASEMGMPEAVNRLDELISDQAI